LSFTSALPANIPKYSYVVLPPPATIAASDTAIGVDVAVVKLLASDLSRGVERVKTRLLSIVEEARGVERIRQLLTVIKTIREALDECLGKLRYVSRGEYVKTDELNTRVDCVKLLRGFLAEKRPDDPIIDELDAVIAKLRYVRAGDIILPEDHNYVVDALRKAREVVAKIEEYYREQLEKLLELRTIVPLTAVVKARAPDVQVTAVTVPARATLPDRQATVITSTVRAERPGVQREVDVLIKLEYEIT